MLVKASFVLTVLKDSPQVRCADSSIPGYRFFVDLFLLFDADNDGGLSPPELNALFATTPGLPPPWQEAIDGTTFPSSTVRNEAGHITLQGWLAQWSMTTFFHPRTTLAYLAYLGYDPPDHNTTSALTLTKARKRYPRGRKRNIRTERNVLLAYVLGAPGSGKSSLLDAFLARQFSTTFHPTIKPRTAVNSVELPGGKQCTLTLEELGELEPAVLENASKLSAADIIVYTYDSSDPDSFAYIPALHAQHPHLAEMPALYVALKADRDRSTQRGEVQPEEWTSGLGLGKPLHVSAKWGSIGEVFVNMAEAAVWPGSVMARGSEGEEGEGDYWIRLWILGGAVLAVGVGAGVIWRRVGRE